MKSLFQFSVLFFNFHTTIIVAQGQIYLSNASLEGQAQDATVPVGWHACDPLTTPDILPGSWGVLTEPEDGETFMGLITREDGTYEQVGQRLSGPIAANQCYTFSAMLAHSSTYAGYNLPVKLRIWGGTTWCKKDQLLAETGPINNEEWKKFEFRFFAKDKYPFIIFEAQFIDGVFFSYNGNILIDSISPLQICHKASL